MELKSIDEDYLKGDDFYDLTRTIFESVIKTKSQKKHMALSRVYLTGIIEKTDTDNDLIYVFSKFIVELMPQQIQVLLFIERNEKELAKFKSFNEFYGLFIEQNISMGIYELNYFCNELVNRSLISFGRGLEDSNSLASLKELQEERYSSGKLTSLGIKFIEFLKN